MKSKILNNAKRKRLRLELLENRSLLTGAPWMFLDYVEVETDDFNSEAGDVAKDEACNHGTRGDAHNITLALMMVGSTESSLDELASGEGQDNGLSSELDTDISVGHEGQLGDQGDAPPPEDPSGLVGSGEAPPEMDMSPPSVEHAIAFGSPQEALRALTRIGQPSGEAVSEEMAAGGSVVFPPSSDLATPLVENGDDLLFDVAQPNTRTDPGASFLAEPFSYSFSSESVSNLNGEAGALRTYRFDLAIQGLEETLEESLPESGNSPAELELLLDSLAQGNREASVVEVPANSVEQEAANSTAEDAKIQESLLQEGGMIALDLPEDLLLDGITVDGEKDQASAWTSHVGIYREHEMNSAKAGRASSFAMGNALAERKLRSEVEKGEDVASSRFRPIAAATSVAFGAIFIGLRRQRDKERELAEANRKLQ